MACVRVVDKSGGCLVVVCRPGEKFDFGWQREMQGAVDARERLGGEVELHEEPRVGCEAGFEERTVDGAGVVEEQLRFDPVDAGRVEEEFQKPVEEGEVGLLGEVGVGGEGPRVSNDGLLALVDAESVSADAAAVKGDKTGEDAGVKVLKKKFGGGAVVPAKALLPVLGFGLKERTKLARGKVPEIEDLELGGDGHLSTGRKLLP